MKKKQDEIINLTLEQLKDLVAGIESKIEEIDMDELHISTDNNMHHVKIIKTDKGEIKAEICFTVEGFHNEEIYLDKDDYEDNNDDEEK